MIESIMRVLDKLREIIAILSRAGMENPAKEAEELIGYGLGITKLALYTGERDITDSESLELDRLTTARLNHMPLQYIIGETDFLDLRIKVGRGVLIPRPETELVALTGIESLKGIRSPKVLDLCTGSGCIALSIANSIHDAYVYAIDNSVEALEYAGLNARINEIENVRFIEGNLFEPCGQLRFDLIISNPPYIRSKDIAGLQPCVKDNEPLAALDGGEDGLSYYRVILAGAGEHLVDYGLIIFEIGIGQSLAIRGIAATEGYSDIRFKKDYSGIDRIAIIKNL